MSNDSSPVKKVTLDQELLVMRNNMTIGYMNGLVLGVCWGVFFGPFQQFSPNITHKQYAFRLMRYQGTSLLKLPPMSAMVRVVGGYLDGQGYSQLTSMSAQLAICFAYLTIVKFPK